MTTLKLRYVHEFRDRHGKLRRYVRVPGRKRVALKGEPGSCEFMATYQAAIEGRPAPELIGASRVVPGTVHAAVASYLNSAPLAVLAPDSRRTLKNILERFRNEHGAKRIATLAPHNIDKMLADRARTPSAARHLLQALRVLMKHCIREGLRADDPTAGIKAPPIKTAGYRTWTEDEIAQYETAHPVGARARLAIALLLYTAQRRADIVKLGPQHVRQGKLRLRQQKTGAQMVLRVHPRLAAVLAATPVRHLTYLATAQGKPFTPPGFTNWFRDMCRAAGLPKGLSAHGLRKAACRRLAELRMTPHQIAAISGHISLREVQRYTAAADQERLADEAMDALTNAFPANAEGTPIGKPTG